MKARGVGLVACAVLAVAGLLAACGGSHPVRPLSLHNAPAPFQDLVRPHKFAPGEVKAAFARQGITLREMRTRYGPHVVVLFDPRWAAPTDFQLYGGRQPPPTYIWVFVHANDSASVAVQDGNIYVSNGPGEGRAVNAALQTLDHRYKH